MRCYANNKEAESKDDRLHHCDGKDEAVQGNEK